MARDNWAVALTKCYYCGDGSDIILPKVLTEKVAAEVKKLDGKVVTMAPCPKCKERMKQGIILLTIDSGKSEKDWDKADMPNPYRTGGYFVVKEAAVRRMFSDEGGALASFALKNRWIFIEHEVAEMFGLFKMAAEQAAPADGE